MFQVDALVHLSSVGPDQIPYPCLPPVPHSLKVNTVQSSKQRDEAKNLANIMNSEYNIGGADKRKEMWKEREEEHRMKQGVRSPTGSPATHFVETAR